MREVEPCQRHLLQTPFRCRASFPTPGGSLREGTRLLSRHRLPSSSRGSPSYNEPIALPHHSPFPPPARRFTIFAGSRHRRDAAQIVKHFHLVLKSLIRVEAPFAIFASFCSKSPLPFPALLRPFQPIHDHGLIYCLVHQQLCRFHHGLRLRQLIQ